MIRKQSDNYSLKDIVRSIFDDGPEQYRKKPLFYGSWEPLADIFEKDDNFVISVDLPGIDPKCINITSENNILTISGNRERCKEFSDNCCFKNERYFGSFEKSFNVPDNIDFNNVKASYNEGVLNVLLPKTPESKKKRISINIGQK